MKVKEMTISDVHQTVVFKNELGRLLSELDYIRKDAIGFKGGRLRSHPIDRLKNDGVWNKTKFIEVYEQTMNKTSNYPKTVRTFILSVGGEAFNKAMKIGLYCLYSRLLKHDLRNPCIIGIVSIPPGQSPFILPVPFQ